MPREKLRKVGIPKQSKLYASNYNYADSYAGCFTDKKRVVNPLVVGKSFFSSAPRWVEVLLTLRNRMVSWVGLKTGESAESRTARLDRFQGQVGERLGLFKVFGKTDRELVLGEDDKHLNFRVSLFIDMDSSYKTCLIISTAVKFVNGWGRLYFLFVKLFHKRVVLVMLKNTLKDIERYASSSSS